MSNDRRSLHFWGVITINGVMPLIKAPEKCSARHDSGFLKTASVPNLLNNGITFVDDNCPIHRARLVEDWKQENNMQEYSWSSHSPDLNPIENVWVYMKRQLHCIVLDHENLEKVVVDIWNKNPTEFLQKLNQSMPNRVNQCLKN